MDENDDLFDSLVSLDPGFVYPVGLEIESIYHRTDSIIVDYNYKTNTGVLMIYPMYKRLIIGHGRLMSVEEPHILNNEITYICLVLD